MAARRRAGEEAAASRQVVARWKDGGGPGARGRRSGAGVDGGSVEGGGVETARRWTTRHRGGGGRSGVEGTGCVAEVDDRALERKQSGRKKNRALYPGP